MKNIYAKLLKIQEENIKVLKDAKNPFFKSNYTTLNEVLEKIRPSLSKNKLALTQISIPDGLKTVLVDTETGESIESIVPYIGTTDMQKLGGAISYARRYALIAMFNLESEDDDGNSAVMTPAKAKATQRVAEVKAVEEILEGIDNMTDINLMKGMLARLDLSKTIKEEDRETVRTYLTNKINK